MPHLPFLEQNALYHRFHLDEPWDSPHNKALLKEMPEVYAPVLPTDEPRVSTYYQVFTGPGALFEDERGPGLNDIKDGTSNTLMVVEAGTPVPWTKPEDIEYDKKKPLPKLGRQFDDGFFGAMADGSVRFFGNNIDKDFLRALITRTAAKSSPSTTNTCSPHPTPRPASQPRNRLSQHPSRKTDPPAPVLKRAPPLTFRTLHRGARGAG